MTDHEDDLYWPFGSCMYNNYYNNVLHVIISVTLRISKTINLGSHIDSVMMLMKDSHAVESI